jgi:hypothetical protein
VLIFGHGRAIDDDIAKLAALEAISEHLLAGRWADARRPTQKELDATAVVAVDIESASAKVRVGPPNDDEEDYALPTWAGVVPLALQPLAPVADPRLDGTVALPPYISSYVRNV